MIYCVVFDFKGVLDLVNTLLMDFIFKMVLGLVENKYKQTINLLTNY